MRFALASLAVAAFAIGAAACGDDDDGPDADPAADETAGEDEAQIVFAAPADGDVVASPVAVEMEAAGVTIEEAGTTDDGTGHFHVMVDVECVDDGEPIPDDEEHLHFGDASTSTELELDPGTYDLCLQLGDGNHVATDLTDEITITVEETDE